MSEQGIPELINKVEEFKLLMDLKINTLTTMSEEKFNSIITQLKCVRTQGSGNLNLTQ